MSPFRFHELNTDGFLMKRLMSDFLNLRCPYNELSHTFRYVEGGGGHPYREQEIWFDDVVALNLCSCWR